VHSYSAPRRDLDEECIATVRESLASRDDIRAPYWLTTIYETERGTVAQDELHIELVEPPEDRADPDQYRDLANTIRVSPGCPVIWSISLQTALDEIRNVGVRVI